MQFYATDTTIIRNLKIEQSTTIFSHRMYEKFSATVLSESTNFNRDMAILCASEYLSTKAQLKKHIFLRLKCHVMFVKD